MLFEVNGLPRRFGAIRALEDVSFHVRAGKSTLFECLTGVLPCDRNKTFMLDKAAWHELKMTVDGASFKALLDGAPVLYPANNPVLRPTCGPSCRPGKRPGTAPGPPPGGRRACIAPTAAPWLSTCRVDLLISTEMKLPGGDNAIVDIAKLRDYCLDPQHPRGRHKARVFAATLGLAQTDAEFLREALLRAAREADARVGESDEYGDRFTVDLELNRGNRRAVVRSAWIVLRGETVPRLTSCFVL